MRGDDQIGTSPGDDNAIQIIGWMMRGLNQRYIAQEAAVLKQRSEERARATP